MPRPLALALSPTLAPTQEANFCRQGDPMDVTYLTQWVSVWQMLFGFVLAPLQVGHLAMCSLSLSRYDELHPTSP